MGVYQRCEEGGVLVSVEVQTGMDVGEQPSRSWGPTLTEMSVCDAKGVSGVWLHSLASWTYLP